LNKGALLGVVGDKNIITEAMIKLPQTAGLIRSYLLSCGVIDMHGTVITAAPEEQQFYILCRPEPSI
jgi:hypothetical protein